MKSYASMILKGDLRVSSEELLTFLQLAGNNEVLYFVLRELAKDTAPGGLVSDLLQREEKVLSEMEDVVARAAAIFSDRGLRSFVMKTFRAYPLTDHDVDVVIVDKDRLGEYSDALGELGYYMEKSRSKLREPLKRFYSSDKVRDGRRGVKIHLHSRVSWNGMEFLDAFKVWEKSVPHMVNGVEVMIPGLEDELLIMAAHAVYENSYLTLGELKQLKGLGLDKSELDLEYMKAESNEYNWNSALRWFYSFAGNCYRCFTGDELLSDKAKHGLCIPETVIFFDMDVPYPLFMPVGPVAAVYWNKLYKDVFSFKFKRIPRDVLSFFLVTWILRARKKTSFVKEITR